jgi:hypothetical protein
MTKRFLQIGFVISISIAAFLLGLYINDCRKDTEEKKEFAADILFSQPQERPSILIVYRKEKTNPPAYYKNGKCISTIYDDPIDNIHFNNRYKSDVDYLIKWDELEDRFIIDEQLLQKEEENFQFWLADFSS